MRGLAIPGSANVLGARKKEMTFLKRKVKPETPTQRINRDLRYEKFLYIEGWAARGRLLAEQSNEKGMRESLMRIHKDVSDLDILLKYNPDLEL